MDPLRAEGCEKSEDQEKIADEKAAGSGTSSFVAALQSQRTGVGMAGLRHPSLLSNLLKQALQESGMPRIEKDSAPAITTALNRAVKEEIGRTASRLEDIRQSVLAKFEAADRMVEELYSDSFGESVRQLFAPLIERGVIEEQELELLLFDLRSAVFEGALDARDLALAQIPGNRIDKARTAAMRDAVQGALASRLERARWSKEKIALGFDLPAGKDRKAPVRDTLSFFKRLLEENVSRRELFQPIELLFRQGQAPRKEDLEGWGGIPVIPRRLGPNGVLRGADSARGYVLTSDTVNLSQTAVSKLNFILAQAAEIKDEKLRELALSSVLYLAILLPEISREMEARGREHPGLLKPEVFRGILEEVSGLGFMRQWFELGPDGKSISFRLASFVESILTAESADQAVRISA